MDQSYKSIRFAERELKGLTYVRAVLSILSDLSSQNAQSPPDTREFELARTRFDTDFSTNAISADLASALSTSSRNFDVALDSARTLLARIGDQSNLILDPELDSYYVMDALLQHVPELILTNRRLSDELSSARTAVTLQPVRTAEVLMRVGQLAARIKGLEKSVEAAIASNPDGHLSRHWAGPAALLVQKLQTLVRGARIDIDINALSDPSAFERPNIASLLAEIDFHTRSFSDVAANELERLLRARMSRFSATLMWSLSFSVMLAAFAIFVAHSVLRLMVVRLDDQIVFLAHHDPLTGLANRALLNDKLKQALTHAERDGGLLAVHLLDLDQFKNVNDTLGHPAGDKLLKLVTSRLRGIVRETDTIARMGGDEFVILQTGLKSESEATALGRRLVEAIANPFAIDEYQVAIGTSIGVAIAAPKGQHSHRAPDDLLRDADVALYRAKGDGRGTFRVFENTMQFEVRERQNLESELRNALNVGQFELYYQPVLNLCRNQVSGFEALIRWRHPQNGLISPATFIPMAEQLGLILPIGEWVIRQACTTAASWSDDLKVGVNLSAVQFKSPRLFQVIVSALASSGLPSRRLVLEITETVLLADTECTLGILRRLRELGVTIAIDDFGTGYASWKYLQSFVFDKIKIDRCFIHDIGENITSRSIVRAVATLAKSLDMETVAEGVETQAQLDMVTSEGCTEMQGFLFSRPLPAGEIGAFMLAQRRPQQGADTATAA